MLNTSLVQALSTLSGLLGVEEEKLESMLLQRVIKTRGEVFVRQLSVPDADLTRDAIVKSLYEVRPRQSHLLFSRNSSCRLDT